MAIGVIIEFLISITFFSYNGAIAMFFEFVEVWWEEILVAWKLGFRGREQFAVGNVYV
jgi:hypothetical protein